MTKQDALDEIYRLENALAILGCATNVTNMLIRNCTYIAGIVIKIDKV